MAPATPPTNAEIALALERVADLLEGENASRHRVAAYRRGAETIRSHTGALADLYLSGGTLAARVAELVRTGSLTLLERLEGEVSPGDNPTRFRGSMSRPEDASAPAAVVELAYALR